MEQLLKRGWRGRCICLFWGVDEESTNYLMLSYSRSAATLFVVIDMSKIL